MRTSIVTMLLVTACLASAAPASAQEAGRVGLTIGYPASVGLLWHVTERIGIRPDLSWSHGSSETTSDSFLATTHTETSRTSWNVGVSALFYARRSADMAVYVVPSYRYSRFSSNTTMSTTVLIALPDFAALGLPTDLGLFADPEDVSDNASSNHQVGAAFGVQHALGTKVALFGELGVLYTKNPAEDFGSSVFHGTRSSQSVGTRSTIGLILYLR